MADNLSLVQVHIGRKQLYYYLARVFLDVPDEDLYLYTEDINKKITIDIFGNKYKIEDI